MTDLTDRIAEVLQTHRWYFVGNLGVPGMPDRKGYRCNCGWVTRDDGGAELADPDAHVAERIEAELNLTEEKHTGWADGDVMVMHRWVSPWTEDTTNVAHDALQPQETAPQHQREDR